MNRRSLRVLLINERVRPDAYALDETAPDETLCLSPTANGWTVFYSERGGRVGDRWFETEAEACDFMADQLLRDSSNRVR